MPSLSKISVQSWVAVYGRRPSFYTGAGRNTCVRKGPEAVISYNLFGTGACMYLLLYGQTSKCEPPTHSHGSRGQRTVVRYFQALL